MGGSDEEELEDDPGLRKELGEAVVTSLFFCCHFIVTLL
jgi:hypothetical protein